MKQFQILLEENTELKQNLFFLDSWDDLNQISSLQDYQKIFIEAHKSRKLFYFHNELGIQVYVLAAEKLDAIRKQGYEIVELSKKEAIKSWNVSLQNSEDKNMAFLEGIGLSCYTFEKYKSKKKTTELVLHIASGIDKNEVGELENLIAATGITKTLVNEPHSFLNAVQYSKEIKVLADQFGFQLEVFDKAKIEAEKMGGILAVNKGSIQHPTFNILSYKAPNAVNEKPIVLVGKGVMYDTGGLSLKPTPNSMDMMKSDMAGSAAVVGLFCAVSQQKLPLNIIGLIPATDNRPGLDAVVPGDVITMYSGKTVEVLNTDAEGRLVLADALHFAKRYQPELVLDLATLTGAAARAIGPQGIACMGNASEEIKNKLKASGEKVHERMVEFPLWDEYESMIKSSIADIKNIGGADAGQTTAALFLQHFVDYPWIHFDIAGAAFSLQADTYKGKGATGVGVRFLYDFLKNRSVK
jgi:leucyl aminopeptidase